MFNMLHNLHILGPYFPLHANNTIVDLHVISSTFPQPTCRVVVSVINPTSLHTNVSHNQSYYHETNKMASIITKLDTPLGGQVLELLDLTR